jgi:hypothetical protein
VGFSVAVVEERTQAVLGVVEVAQPRLMAVALRAELADRMGLMLGQLRMARVLAAQAALPQTQQTVAQAEGAT